MFFQNFAKFTWKHLCRSHFLTTLQIWKLIKKILRHSYFPVNFAQFFKNLIYRKPPDDCSCWFLCSNQSIIHWSHFACFFHFFFYYWWLQLWTLLRNCLKTTIFLLFPIVYSKINMLLRKLRLGNNLPTHIKENTNFLRQKPRQLPSAEAVFERCYFRRGQVKRPNNPLSFTALAVLTIIL